MDRLTRLAVLFALAVSPYAAWAADRAAGERIAQRWCAACHIASPGQTRGADGVPTFEAIALDSAMNQERFRAALIGNHPAMPDAQLTRAQFDDLWAYVRALR
jgi:mono/diheme cytochrome c family protein